MPLNLPLFFAATVVIAATPGPNMLLVMTSSMRSGFRRSFITMAGCLTSVVSMILLSALGLDVALRAAPRAFFALRAAGAAYLLYLAYRMWTSEPAPLEAAHVPKKGLYREGVLVAASNPKAILFAAAFLPQFIDPAQARGPQFGVLVALFAVIEVSCYLAYALAGRQAVTFLEDPRRRRLVDRGAGALFAAFALAMVRG